MTPDEYSRICDRLARKAIRFAAEKIADEVPADDFDAQCEHWIDVYLDEHLPSVDADVLLAVTSNANAWMKKNGSFYATAEVRATHAFQADVWDAINRTEPRVYVIRDKKELR